MNPKKLRRVMMTMLVSGSICFQFGIGFCRETTEILNPCGSVFTFCTAEQLDFMNNPVPNFQDFPNCTVPLEDACGEPSIFPPGPGSRPEGPDLP